MIQTIHYTNKNFPIPSNLVMERVLNLEEKLEGQSIKIKSVFNEKDNDPSMIVFYSTDEEIYRFKDFSTGEYGDAVDIVLGLYKLENRQKAYRKILDIFKDDTDIPRQLISSVKITKEVSEFKVRKWLNVDAEYWKQFGIGGTFLKMYNIKPLESYTIKMTKGEEVSTMEFDHKKCYGYFNMKGELCKIYQPARKDAKFLKTKDLTQGEEQLTYDKKCLIIASSLKDIGAFKSMKFPDIDLVAPDSENVTITQEQIIKYRQHYQYIFTMFDNDVPGMNAMKKYKELYDIPYIYFNIEKDIADCVKQHGIESTKIFFKPIFKDAIKRSQNTKITRLP